jgi:hypothetical protein
MRLIFVLVLLAGFAALGLGAYWMFAPGAGSSGGPAAARGPDAAPKAEAQKGEVTLDIGERELTQVLSQELAGRPIGQTPLGTATVEQIQVSLRSGRAEVSGTARVGGNSVPYTALASAAPDAEGRARVQLTDARVANLPLPEAGRAQLEATVQRQLDQLVSARRMRVRSIEIGDGRMRIIGTPL